MTQERIEEAVANYMLNNMKEAKYVIMSEKSYNDFVQSFLPIERIVTQPTPAQSLDIAKMYCSKGVITIISASNVQDDFFEVI